MDYEAMLKKAREDLPESAMSAERFEIPKVMGHVQGNKTIISNFQAICSTLNRNLDHVLKLLLKELATPGVMKRGSLMLGAKVSAAKVNEKIRKYATEYVLCKTCGKPDTKLIKEGQVNYLRCQACGAKHVVKGR